MTLPPRNYAKRGTDGRLRSPSHLAFIRKHLCVGWKMAECIGKVQAAHCRDIAPRGHGGAKPDDLWCVGMCARHHRESEKREREWGTERGIDIRALCLEYAMKSPDKRIREAAKKIIDSERKT